MVARAFSLLVLESKTLQGVKGENSLSVPGHHHLENTTVDFQKFPDKEVLRMAGPLGADFTIKVRTSIHPFQATNLALVQYGSSVSYSVSRIQKKNNKDMVS